MKMNCSVLEMTVTEELSCRWDVPPVCTKHRFIHEDAGDDRWRSNEFLLWNFTFGKKKKKVSIDQKFNIKLTASKNNPQPNETGTALQLFNKYELAKLVKVKKKKGKELKKMK